MNGAFPALRMRQVGRVHGRGRSRVTALSDVDLDVVPGEMVAVTGRSGSGKSTLLQLAGGLDEPTTGTVQIAGIVLGDQSRTQLAALRRTAIGFVFQDLNLLPTLTAAENIALPLELDGHALGDARRSAERALADVGMAPLRDRYPDELSGGEQQRIAIARGLVGTRRLLLADEPTGALDEQTGEGVLRLLRERCDAGAACVLATHDLTIAAWADRVVRLRDGRIASATTRRAVPLDPAEVWS